MECGREDFGRHAGQLVNHGGDLDNRIKTLLDALRKPSQTELPADDLPTPHELPFYCLLQDDALITTLSVTTDRLLAPAPPNDVELIILVDAHATRKSMSNDCIW